MKKDYASRARDYLAWSAARRGVFVPLAHIAICERDWPAAILLSQLVYWFHPSRSKASPTRATIQRDGAWWVAKPWHELARECGFADRKQVTRSLTRLRDLGIIRTQVWQWGGSPTTHITIVWAEFFDRLDAVKHIEDGDDLPDVFEAPPKAAPKAKSFVPKTGQPFVPKKGQT